MFSPKDNDVETTFIDLESGITIGCCEQELILESTVLNELLQWNSTSSKFLRYVSPLLIIMWVHILVDKTLV